MIVLRYSWHKVNGTHLKVITHKFWHWCKPIQLSPQSRQGTHPFISSALRWPLLVATKRNWTEVPLHLHFLVLGYICGQLFLVLDSWGCQLTLYLSVNKRSCISSLDLPIFSLSRFCPSHGAVEGAQFGAGRPESTSPPCYYL